MAAKKKTAFFCTECGYESAKWMGQCPACRAWNSFVEELKAEEKGRTAPSSRLLSGAKSAPVPLSKVEESEGGVRYATGFGEFDRVLGGGLVEGSLTLLGGDPGIGKSTILLQVARNLSLSRVVLYISGEESLSQIKLRAERIGSFSESLLFLCETDLEAIEQAISDTKPSVVIIDSIQTMFNADVQSAPGSVSQVRETTGVLLKIAKQNNIAFFIVGHVTKEGTVAGPRVLEHMVDTVLYLEGERHVSYRIMRAVKNRFGGTNEIGVFEMRESGLAEVLNPSEYMLEGRPENASGTIVGCAVEGTRPILIEIQALLSRTAFGYPRRQATGMDVNRLNLLVAVLEKRLKLQISEQDVYVNIAGGLKLNEPALDLSVCLALISAFSGTVTGDETLAFGEVGLSGEVRAVSLSDQRVAEAVKLGFKKIIVPAATSKRLKNLSPDVTLHGVKTVAEAAKLISLSK